MKLTPYKITRIKSFLPEEDKKQIDKEFERGDWSSKTKALLDHWAEALAPNRLKSKGGFGRRGTTRKATNLKLKREALQKALEEAKENEEADNEDSSK